MRKTKKDHFSCRKGLPFPLEHANYNHIVHFYNCTSLAPSSKLLGSTRCIWRQDQCTARVVVFLVAFSPVPIGRSQTQFDTHSIRVCRFCIHMGVSHMLLALKAVCQRAFCLKASIINPNHCFHPGIPILFVVGSKNTCLHFEKSILVKVKIDLFVLFCTAFWEKTFLEENFWG